MKVRRDLGIGSQSKVSVDADLERLKVICYWEDVRRKRVPVTRCHMSRVGECVCSVSIQFKHVGVLSLRKLCISIINFISSEQKPW